MRPLPVRHQSRWLYRWLIAALLLGGCCPPLLAGEIQLAVASNFLSTMKHLGAQFEEQTGHRVRISAGSTGKLYAQITQGAPFDAFFAADARRPQLLEEKGLTLDHTRFTYAVGRLVLWSPHNTLIDDTGQVLASSAYRHLALANPRLAPYGRAAQQVLQARELEHDTRRRIVRGENIGQTFQFVRSGNADLGFIALSQLKSVNHDNTEGSAWLVPQSLYSPIEQQAVLLRESEIGRDFMKFMRNDSSLALIRQHGYLTP